MKNQRILNSKVESMSSESESKTVIDYLMRENVRLKQEIESLKNSQSYAKSLHNLETFLIKLLQTHCLYVGAFLMVLLLRQMECGVKFLDMNMIN